MELIQEQPLTEQRELLRAGEAAELLGVTPRTINSWCREGKFPGAFRVNPDTPYSRWRIPKKDVEDLKTRQGQ